MEVIRKEKTLFNSSRKGTLVMIRKMIPWSVMTMALLLLTNQKASATSPYDLTALEDLTAAHDYATSAYDDHPDSIDAYYAYYYSYYAQYYASYAYTYDDQNAWYWAYLYAQDAYSYALDDYDLTGDPNAFYAYYYSSYGSMYAYDAYTY